MRLSAIAPFASDHHGLITRAEAAKRGVSKSAWYRACGSGLLDEVHSGVARIPGTVRTREQQICAAVMAAQPGAMASHRTAAYLLGVPRPDDDPIEVILVDRRRRPVLTGVLVHRPRDLGDLRPTRRRGIPTTNILRTLCDLGAVDPDGLAGALGHVASLKLASLAAIQAAIARHSRRGRAGIPALRRALEEWTIGGKVPDSVLEPAMRKLLDDYGIRPWQFHAVICDYEVDFWIVGTPVVLECDGWDFHARTREQMERDAERDSVLIAAGYLPVHFTYRQIMKQPAKVAARISSALGHWSGGIRVS